MQLIEDTIASKDDKNQEPSTWLKLAPLVYEFQEEAFSTGGYMKMTPAWRLFLFGDGSPTHHLSLLTASETQVDVIGLQDIGDTIDTPNAPNFVNAIATPRCRRQVWLRNARGERLGYATSWICTSDVNQVFTQRTLPIGRNIVQNKTELFRDMKLVFCGTSKVLEHEFGYQGPFWGRTYLFWKGGRPLTLIYEVFSPHLEKYMGNVLEE